MFDLRSCYSAALLSGIALASLGANAADLIVSAQDGKFVRVEGRATYPEPAPSEEARSSRSATRTAPQCSRSTAAR